MGKGGGMPEGGKGGAGVCCDCVRPDDVEELCRLEEEDDDDDAPVPRPPLVVVLLVLPLLLFVFLLFMCLYIPKL